MTKSTNLKTGIGQDRGNLSAADYAQFQSLIDAATRARDLMMQADLGTDKGKTLAKMANDEMDHVWHLQKAIESKLQDIIG